MLINIYVKLFTNLTASKYWIEATTSVLVGYLSYPAIPWVVTPISSNNNMCLVCMNFTVSLKHNVALTRAPVLLSE